MSKGERILWCYVFLWALQVRAEQYDWVNRFAGTSSSGTTIALDESGNVYVAGTFSGTLTLGTNHLMSAGGSDIFIAKLSSNGAPLWATSAGGQNDDQVYRIAIASNGAVFLCGVLASNAMFGTNMLDTGSDGLWGGYVARIDNGILSWIDQFAPSSHGSAESLTLSRNDQSVWVVGENGTKIFIKCYKQDGTIVTNFFVGDPSDVYTTGIAASTDGNIFITGTFYQSLNLGTTNLTANYNAQFTAGMNSGRVIWAWVVASGYPSSGEAVGLGPDGAVISVGHLRRSDLPDRYAFIAKHSASGTFQWSQILGEFRGDYGATDVTVDANRYILATGWAAGYYPNPASRSGVLLAIYDPNGNKLFEHHINSVLRADHNAGGGIAVDAIGNVVFTGYLEGTPMFGTNVMGDGLSGVANAFVARRPTLEPTLALRRSGTNFSLIWPRTGMPFALQQTEGISSTSWSNVLSPPEEMQGDKRLTLAAENVSGFFRLKMTNEVPIRHLPFIYDPLQVNPAPSFLGRYPVFVTTNTSISSPVFIGYASDVDDDDLTFEWFNADTGQRLTNGTSTTWYLPTPDALRTWVATLHDDGLRFPIGTNTISLVAFDEVFRATNSVMIEVLSVPTAIDGLIASVLAVTMNPAGENLVAPLRSARDAFERGLFDNASQQLEEFRTRVQNSVDLSNAQKTLFNDAAQKILEAFPSG